MEDPTKLKVIEYAEQLKQFIENYESRVEYATTAYEDLIQATLQAQKKSLTFKTAVGAAVQVNNGKIFMGAVVENITRAFDDHAEKIAIIKALQSECKPRCEREDIMALAVVYGSKVPARPDIEGVYAYPMCGFCRQFAWENTHPDLEVIVVDPDAAVIFAGPLKILYLLPYPSKIYNRIKVN